MDFIVLLTIKSLYRSSLPTVCKPDQVKKVRPADLGRSEVCAVVAQISFLSTKMATSTAVGRTIKAAAMERSMHMLKTELHHFQGGIGETHCGVATHLIDPHNFYIVPLMCYRLIPLLEKPGSVYENIHVNATVIYKSPTLEHYVRGQVQKILPNELCEIYAMDYGIVDNIKTDSIFKPMLAEAENIPPLAQLCKLSQCYPPGRGSTFNEKQIEAFKRFMGDDGEKLTVTIVKMNNSKLEVHVMSSHTNPNDISTVLFLLNHTVYLPAPL